MVFSLDFIITKLCRFISTCIQSGSVSLYPQLINSDLDNINYWTEYRVTCTGLYTTVRSGE
jgi:hypothetical protein